MYAGPRHVTLNRRTMVQAGSIGLLGLGLNHVSALRQARGSPLMSTGGGRAKSVIFVFLSGGLAQHDSFDPKPNAPAGIRGEFSAIATRSPGIQICEHLPLLAERSQKWSLIRSLTTPFNGHSEGHMSILSGRSIMPPSFSGSHPSPGDWPSIASVVGEAFSQRSNNLPPAVALPERLIHRSGRVLPGQFGGQMGSRRDPFFVEASPYNAETYGAYPDYEFHFARGRQRTESLKFQAPSLSLPQGLTMQQLGDRNALLKMFNKQRAELEQAAAVESFDNYRQSAISLLTDGRMQKAFDVHNANPRDLDRYGRNAFGWSLLMARQLVELGVALIQVNLGNNESWDTHEGNFTLLRDCLLPPTDRGLSALLDDLDERGLLDETMIVMCGEMGRTPKVNANKLPGRDHWGAVQSVFIAGGGIPGGVVVGESDKDGGYPKNAPQLPENLAATIYHALGIPETASWTDEANRPWHIYHGQPIEFA